ncbi:unnamed protein product [Aphanomyces euteiches]
MSRSQRPPNTTPQHLLWALMFLKTYATEGEYHALTGADEKTFRKRSGLHEFVNSDDGSVFAKDLLRRFSINGSASRNGLVRSFKTDGTWAGDMEISSVPFVKQHRVYFQHIRRTEVNGSCDSRDKSKFEEPLSHFPEAWSRTRMDRNEPLFIVGTILRRSPVSMHAALELRLVLWCTKSMTTDEVHDGKKQLSLSDFKWCKKPQTTVKKHTRVKQRASKD